MLLKTCQSIILFLILMIVPIFSQTKTVNPLPEQKKEKAKKQIPTTGKTSQVQSSKKENK